MTNQNSELSRWNMIKESIKKWVKHYWGFLFLAAFVLLLLLLLVYDGDLQNKVPNSDNDRWVWNHEVLSALLGAATVATITFVLLKGQASNQTQVEQNKRVFDNKLNAYEHFLKTLEEVVISSKITPEMEKRLQFSVAVIGLHADSEDMLTISKNLKGIVRKIKYEERVDGSIWYELMQIVSVFQHSLYIDDDRKIDVNMKKFIRNLSSLCVDDTDELLEKIECMLLSYSFNSFISAHCLFYEILVKREVSTKYNLPNRVYVTLKIDKESTDEQCTGLIALYMKEKSQCNIDKIYKNNELWAPNMFAESSDSNENTNSQDSADSENTQLSQPSLQKIPKKVELEVAENLMLGINIITYARVFRISNPHSILTIQVILADLINYMYPVWAEKDKTYLRKDQNGNVFKRGFAKKI